ncbi:MAG: hypothetical protein ACLUVM_16500 [Blautia faecis]
MIGDIYTEKKKSQKIGYTQNDLYYFNLNTGNEEMTAKMKKELIQQVDDAQVNIRS